MIANQYSPVPVESSSQLDLTTANRPTPTPTSAPRPFPFALSYNQLNSDGYDSDASSNDEVAPAYLQKELGVDGEDKYRADGFAEEGRVRLGGAGTVPLLKHQRRRRVVILLIALASFGVVIIVLAGHSRISGNVYRGGAKKEIQMDHIFNGTFAPTMRSLDWLGEAGDGVFSYRGDDSSIRLEDVSKNSTRVLVSGSDIRDSNGDRLYWNDFSVSSDLSYILFAVDRQKLWRHSSHSNFYIYNLAEKKATPLVQPTRPPLTSKAIWAPKGHAIAYVHANDLYVLENPTSAQPIRVTTSGSKTILNGVPDWVYEEEVFSGDSATWWSPDGKRLAFLTTDETAVPEYSFPIYNPSNSPGAIPYPEETTVKYPKPGYPNPTVSLHVFDLDQYQSAPSTRPTKSSNDLTSIDADTMKVAASLAEIVFDNTSGLSENIVTEVSWMGSHELIVKQTNRIANRLKVAHVDMNDAAIHQSGKLVGKVVRDVDFAKLDGGWAEEAQTVRPLDLTGLSAEDQELLKANPWPEGYLDIVPNAKGFSHIALFSPADSSQPVYLTDGPWEVVDGIQSVDLCRGLIYFIAADPSIERHLASIPIPSQYSLNLMRQGAVPPEPKFLTNRTTEGYYSTSFSPESGFYVLSHQGPDVPWQRLVKVDDTAFEDVLEENANLRKTLGMYKSPTITRGVLKIDGQDFNVMEMRPPNLDTSGRSKAPVLFRVYGGPASQMVDVKYFRDWHAYLATTLGVVVVTFDGRGTGFKGRKFRMPVSGHLGDLESLDVVKAAKYYSRLNWVDPTRIGVWGWSYGGYLTGKVIERDSGVFTLGMSVAPVTDWRFYDSIYTERYMSTPQLNPVGYQNSSISKMDGFRHADYLLAHGSGDDNVHYLHSASLLDMLTVEHVRNFRFRMFTDSDHSISRRGAYREIFEFLTAFLTEKWQLGGRRKPIHS